MIKLLVYFESRIGGFTKRLNAGSKEKNGDTCNLGLSNFKHVSNMQFLCMKIGENMEKAFGNKRKIRSSICDVHFPGLKTIRVSDRLNRQLSTWNIVQIRSQGLGSSAYRLCLIYLNLWD